MGTAGTPQEPLLMGVGDTDGTGDGVMVYKDVEGLAHTYCQRGVSVQLNVYAGDDHTKAAVAFLPAATVFLMQRLGGTPVRNGCGSIPAGNALTPLPPAPALVFDYRGYRHKLHAALVYLRATIGTMNGITVTLHRGRRRVAARTFPRLTTRRRRLVLRARRAGRYTIAVAWQGVTQATRSFRIR
jgi:hypothetical protein